MTHAELVEVAARWLRRKGCRIVLSEFTALCSEIPDVLAWRGTAAASYLIEAKASRSDFLADRKKPFRAFPETGVGQYRYFICRPGVITVGDLPDRWGLLYANDKTVTIERGKDPARCAWPEDPFRFDQFAHRAERTFLLSALRRLQLHHGEKTMCELMHATMASKAAGP